MSYFLFGVFPYIALTIMIVGSIVRYEVDPFSWKSKSSQFLRRRQLVVGSALFHIGVLIIFFGHLVGLLTPFAIMDLIGLSDEAHQIIAMVSGGIAGVIALIGAAMLLHRRLTDSRIRKTSSRGDIFILVLIVIQLVLGLCTIFVSAQHLDGVEMVKLMKWAQGIIYFGSNPAAHLEGVNILFKLHIIVGLLIFAAVPFTRLVHIFSAPIRFLWRPGYQVVRTRRGAKPARSALDPMPRRQ
ncbi:MAG TPA: respiratory nitrate reductase subunit gamma [Paenalcaligenes sp.]|nr:respiratory nitrate reductase subunit gamma [Paenalcaligenes sp.]